MLIFTKEIVIPREKMYNWSWLDEIEVCENSFTKLTEDPKLGLIPQH